MTEQAYLYCRGQGGYPLQSARGYHIRKETRLQAEAYQQGGTSTDHGTAHAGEVTGAYPESVHLFSVHRVIIYRCKTALSLAYRNNCGRKTLHPHQQEENRCRFLYTVTSRSRADIVSVQYNR